MLMDSDGQRMGCSQYMDASSQSAFVERTGFVVVTLHMQ